MGNAGISIHLYTMKQMRINKIQVKRLLNVRVPADGIVSTDLENPGIEIREESGNFDGGRLDWSYGCTFKFV